MRDIQRIVVLVGALAAAALATGCASIAGGNTQKMYVQARSEQGADVDGADCTLSNDKGTWRIRSPGDTTIVRSYKPIEVRCEKAPLPRGVVSVESGVRAAMFGNILIGGVIGVAVDHASGAAYEYPEMIRVVMGRSSSFSLPRAGNTPPATGFAALQDVEAVPYMGDRGREGYRTWLKLPQPRAFAIASNHYYFSTSGTRPKDTSLPTDPVQRALAGCERNAHVPCKLYAVNDQVVWEPEPAAAAAAAPGGGAMRVAASMPAQSGAAGPGAHPQAGFIASGYAAVEDVDALPYLSDRGRAEYREWLTRPTPKAFAISDQGHWWATSGLKPQDTTLPSDPSERALVACQRAAGVACKLYAVNGSVVWKPEPMNRP